MDSKYIAAQQIMNIIITTILLLTKKRSKRRWWVRPIYRNRFLQGDYHNLIQEMRLQDTDMFFNYTRMTVESFDKLLALVGPHIRKHSNRPAIQEGARLALTLRLLASGDSLQSIAFAFRMGKSTVCEIFKETSQALWTVLQPIYLRAPSEDDWKSIAAEFSSRWQFPNTVGAVDGKHVTIQAPNKSGSMFYNYKKNYSVVLFAVCDANYLFTSVDIGAYGSQTDGGVLKESAFGYNLLNNKLNLPKYAPLPGTQIPVQFYFVGDEAFPLQMNILRPYSGRYLEESSRIFNYRLSRARRCIENAFGILAARWRIFHKTIQAFPENVDRIIQATICLHNYIMMEESNVPGRKYCNPCFVDREDENGDVQLGDWRNVVPATSALQHVTTLRRRLGPRNARAEAVAFREYMKDYVNGIGQVNWQTEHIRSHAM